MKNTRWAFVIPILMAAVAVSVFAQQQPQRGPSTPEERAAVVELAKKLQQNPIDKNLNKEREQLLIMLIQVPDIHMTICAGDETPWIKEKYKYSSELTATALFSTAAYVIEQGGTADEKAAHLAGLEGAIKAYQAILAQNPKAKWQPMEDLIAKQQSGELKKASAKFCSKKG